MTKEIAARCVEIDLVDEIEANYAKYTTETIENRALPSAKDGLKPVQRRILTAMFEDGMQSKGGTHKSAKAVGSVMGRYHPHGDSSIYDALVRMAADYTFRVPLIHGHGNFGSPQSDPAASRYTECKLSEAGELIVGELSPGTTQMKPGELDKDEPVELPARFPNLLVNGSMGIAVAMSTNIPPHNLSEVLSATIEQLDNQKMWDAIAKAKDDEAKKLATYALVDRLMNLLPAPDFPTGGVIVGASEGVREAFATGSGTILVKPSVSYEQKKNGESWVVFTSLPYGVNPTKIVDSVIEAERKYIQSTNSLRENPGGKVDGYIIEGLTGVNDATDENGVRIVFKVKPRFNPEKIAAEVLSRTGLQSNFSYNMNALFNGVPKVATLPEILQTFINFRRSITKSRSQQEREKIKGQLHLIDGLLKVILDIDKAYQIIRASENQQKALAGLRTAFGIDATQAKHILDTQLKRLTKYDSHQLEQESNRLHKRAEELDKIIGSRAEQDKAVRRELKEMLDWSKKNGYDIRKSELSDVSLNEFKDRQAQRLEADDELSDEPVTLFFDHQSKIYRRRRAHNSTLQTTVFGSVILFGSDGTARRAEVSDLGSRLPDGTIGVLNEGEPIFVATKMGVTAAYEPNYPTRSDAFPYINLGDGDEVVSVTAYDSEKVAVYVSKGGQALFTQGSNIGLKATLNGKGVAGMKLKPDDEVVYATMTEYNDKLGLYTTNGLTVKGTALTNYPMKGRGTAGVATHKVTPNNPLVTAMVAPSASLVKGQKTEPFKEPMIPRTHVGTKNSDISHILSN